MAGAKPAKLNGAANGHARKPLANGNGHANGHGNGKANGFALDLSNGATDAHDADFEQY